MVKYKTVYVYCLVIMFPANMIESIAVGKELFNKVIALKYIRDLFSVSDAYMLHYDIYWDT